MTTSNLTLWTYDSRTTSDSENAALHRFYLRLDQEERPDDPPLSLELFVSVRRHMAPFVQPASFALWAGDIIVATADMWTLDTADNQHAADFRLAVLPEYRRRGLAHRLLDCVVRVAAERNRRLLLTRTASSVPAGEAFLQRLGAKPGLPTHTNQLAIAALVLRQGKNCG